MNEGKSTQTQLLCSSYSERTKATPQVYACVLEIDPFALEIDPFALEIDPVGADDPFAPGPPPPPRATN